MAVVLKTKEIVENDEPGAYSASVLIHAFDSANAVLTALDVRSALPSIGSTYLVGSATTYLRSRRLQPIARSNKRGWACQLEYGQANVDEAFTATSSRVGSIAVDIYRTGASMPGSLSAPATTDIGGTKVDTAGDPVSLLIPRQELRVRNYVEGLDYSLIAGLVGKRNSSTFLGKAAGYLLFLGATDTRVGESRYEVEYEFVYDGLAHLRQKPKLDQDRQPELLPDGDGIARAKHVFWVQPFPATGAFSGLGIVL